MLHFPLKRLRFQQASPFSSNSKKFRNDIVTERISRQDKDIMELNQDSIGVKSDDPTKPTGERQEVRETGETTAPLADVVTQLSTLLTRAKVSDGAEATIPPFDGTYSAIQFFQAFDRKMEDATMGEQEKLLRLPNYLVRQPLELFRKLRLADRSYFQVRQILLDLYPESSEASFAKYFAMKLTGQANLETYYREKTAMGLQLGLPQEVILETLTEGLPFSDQRLVRVVPPENLGEWFRLVQRIHGPSVRTTTHPVAQVHGMHLFRRPTVSSAARGTGIANADIDQSRRPTKKSGQCKQSQNNQSRVHSNQVKPETPQPSRLFETENKFNVPCLRIPPVKIPTNSDKIITIRPYRVPICDQQEIRKQVQQMLENGIIEQSFSPFSSPVTLVTKRDKTKRFCIDYRKVNELISSDVHPLPRIEDILDRLAQAKYFSTADISSAYWQVPIHPDSRPLLAFATLEGLYQPTRLPFGLKTSPQIYERAISQVLQRHGLDCVAHYFDDFIIYSNTLEEHQNHLRQFFAFCEIEKLQLNFVKCEFFKQSIDFLGYTITAGTITPLTRNTDIIHAIKQPHNRKTLQSFLGAVNVYNKFIPEYARLRAPLNNLLKKDVVWNWNEACQKAFIDLKGNLTQHPILHLYKEGLPCQVYCDASTLGIAGILKQVHPDGNVYPFQYFSRTLRPHEKNYSISELEFLAIVESVEKFRIYLMGRKFTIFYDHHALQWLKTIKNPSGRLFRWSLRLSSYEYEVHYIKGKLQYEADLLSRNPFCGFLNATLIKTHQTKRAPVRSQVTRISKEIISNLRIESKDYFKATVGVRRILDVQKVLLSSDKEIIDILAEDDEADLEKEMDDCAHYQEIIIEAIVAYEDAQKQVAREVVVQDSLPDTTEKIRLPTIELPKFSSLKEWSEEENSMLVMSMKNEIEGVEKEDSETAVDSYVGVKEAESKDYKAKDSEPKSDGVKDSETAIKGYESVNNSEEKIKANKVEDSEVADQVKTCHTCQLTKRPLGPTYGELSQPPEAKEPFNLLSLDTIAGFSKYGNTKIYLHVVVDHFSRYAWTFPSKSTSITTYQQKSLHFAPTETASRIVFDSTPRSRFRTGQGRCAELMKLWGYTKDPNCACNVPQSMSHILDDCPLYKFNGGISNLHSVTPEALKWLKALPLRL
ncbi:K02A2.6-like [Cordylochernes scorpioides]|uniref:K02A2.6-like n=1 Tax=Cordylochernes scorpioides TaxID=51811 RepID=A0ABY6LGF5_9ARAC|nr:K02A2.6-like [Cordylochernes scorpioides]